MKKCTGVILAVVLAFCPLSPAAAAMETDALTHGQSSVELTQEWFATQAGVVAEDEAIDAKWKLVLDEYTKKREADLSGRLSLCEPFGYASGQMSLDQSAVAQEDKERAYRLEKMQERLNISIKDAKTTVVVQNAEEQNGLWVIDLYEWTFFDYDDLDDGQAKTDVSGFGVTHRLTLKETEAGGYELLEDCYDEGALTGMSTVNEENKEAGEPQDGADYCGEAGFTLQQQSYASYNAQAAVAYADRYVCHDQNGSVNSDYYNSAYVNLNGQGGDCTNYTSQCFYAGGMPMDSTWFYRDGNFTRAWATARYQYKYMSAKGKAISNPSGADIRVGSPVYYANPGRDISHSAICVGTNSAGTPVVNAHNNDYYHVKWNYWGSSTNYYTVQLSASSGGSALITIPETVSDPSLGDANCDGVINASDALFVLQISAQMALPTDKQRQMGDVTRDGQVAADDALLILKKSAGLISEF